jgi:hypothetical protein
MSENISENFKWSELTISGGHPELARQAADDWTDRTRQNAEKLIKTIWQPIRDLIGVPIRVNSCYRPIYLNDAVGSKRSSQHITASALDGQPTKDKATSYETILRWCLENREKFGQAIFYWGDFRKGEFNKIGFVHISLVGGKQGQIMYKERGGGYIEVYPSIK